MKLCRKASRVGTFKLLIKKKKNILLYSLLIVFALVVNIGIYNSANAIPFGDKEEMGTDCVDAQTGEKLWDCHDCVPGEGTCEDKTCLQCEDDSTVQ